jgi:Reverse transcriptase (RNA-dependent DNA polymerase).
LYDNLIKFGVPKKLVGLIKTSLDDTQSKVRIGNYLSSSFPINNILKKGDCLSPLLFNYALECAIRKESAVDSAGYDGTHQAMAYGDAVDLIGNAIKQ